MRRSQGREGEDLEEEDVRGFEGGEGNINDVIVNF